MRVWYAGPMERRTFQTPLGEIWLWGSPDAFDGRKPVVLVICGAFQAADNAFLQLQPYHPDAAVLIGHLPGNHCPELSEAGIAALGLAYRVAARQAARGRPVVLCGVSTGSLVALAMDAPEVSAMVLIEPPLRTAKLWPLIAPLRARAKAEPWAARFVEGVFGYYPGRVEDRDYRPLLSNLKCRAWVLLGDVPLMPERELSELPSLVDEPERALLRAHPHVRIVASPGVGHNIPAHHAQLIDAALRKTLGELTPVR